MSIFGDIADAVGGAADWVGHAVGDVEHAVSDVANSGLVKTALNFGGTMFGDPGLGNQIAGGLSAIDKIFGKGSSAGKTLSRAAVPQKTLGYAGLAPSRAGALVRVKLRGRYVTMSRANLTRLVAALKARSPGRSLLAPPITLTVPPVAPPPPPPITLASPEIRAILANPEAVKQAVENGTPIALPGGRVLDPTVPVTGVPVGMRSDVIALGLPVIDPSPRYEDDTGPGARGTRDI